MRGCLGWCSDALGCRRPSRLHLLSGFRNARCERVMQDFDLGRRMESGAES